MESSLILFLALFIGMILQTPGLSAGNFNQTYSGLHGNKNRPGKRNTKFIIPALISHMYHQKLDECPLSTMLNRPFAKRVGKQDTGKRESTDDSLEQRTIVGNPKRDEHVRNVPKTKGPAVKTKESPVLLEAQEKENKHGENNRYNNRHNGANTDRGGNVIQVSKHFSPLGRNWYAGPPSVMWPPPVPYPNSYGMPMEQYPNPRFQRPLYPGRTGFQQEGFIQHIMGPNQKFLANLKDDAASKNLVAQERKFMVTNITKYVLDFYCPHCGGEISVSKNRNRGGLFGSEQGAVSINKGGARDPNQSKQQSTTASYPKETKTQQLN